MRQQRSNIFNKKTEKTAIVVAALLVVLLIVVIFATKQKEEPEEIPEEPVTSEETAVSSVAEPVSEPEPVVPDVITSMEIAFDTSWTNGQNSEIHTGSAVLWKAKPSISNGYIICVNAGHGTEGGSSVKTLCHPDGTPKVTGGTTDAGETMAVAVSTGTEFLDGTPEAEANLAAAVVLKEKLLERGYSVLMIRESSDVQLDNIARTVMANHFANVHIALHYDSTDWDKGVYFMSVPSSSEYRSMEPVASHYEGHNALGRAVVKGISEKGLKLFENGELEMDLTQTSYSEIPSIDLEIGDRATDPTAERNALIAEGIIAGLDEFFGVSPMESAAAGSLAEESAAVTAVEAEELF